MQTTGVTTLANSNPSPNRGTVTSQATRDEFLKLLVTQIQHQDPLNPITDANFAAQLAQFSTLEGIEKLNSNFSDMLLLQELTQGASLIGKRVMYQPLGEPSTRTGTVEAIYVQDGKLQLSIGGSPIALNQIRGMTTS